MEHDKRARSTLSIAFNPGSFANPRMLLVLQLHFVFVRRKVDIREFLRCARIGTLVTKRTAYAGQQSRLVILTQP